MRARTVIRRTTKLAAAVYVLYVIGDQQQTVEGLQSLVEQHKILGRARDHLAQQLQRELKVERAVIDAIKRRVTVKDVIVLRGDRTVSSTDHEVARLLLKDTPASAVLMLPDEVTIESLDESAMLEHGWIKARGRTIAGGAGAL